MTSDTTIVAMAGSLMHAPVKVEVAQFGAHILTAPDPSIQALLLEAGVLEAAPADNKPPQLRLHRLLAQFDAIVYVKLASEGKLRCVCADHGLYAQCEHSVFVSSLALPGHVPTVSLGEIPTSRKRGRPVGSTSVARRRTGAKAKAGPTAHCDANSMHRT